MFEKFIHQTPFLRLVLPLILGIIFKINLPELNIPYLIILLAIILILFALHFTKQAQNYLTNRIWGISISVFFFVFGAELVNIKQQAEFSFENKEYTFIATVIEKPQEKEKSFKTILKLEAFKDSNNWNYNCSQLLAYFEKDSLFKINLGDRLLVKSYINEIQPNGNPYAFNYKNYLKFKEIYSQTYIESKHYKIVGQNNLSGFKLLSHHLREKLHQTYINNNINGNELAVLSALTLGLKNELTPELKASFSASGSMHVLAVSGLHVGIIFIILSKILFFLNRKRYGKVLQTFIIITVLIFYAALTGLSNSVIRATIMFSFISIGNIFNRQNTIYNSLSAAAFCMLIYNPYALMEVGFQLSFLAVISIVFFQPRLSSLYQPKFLVINYLWQLITVAIAAQIITFPLTIYYFNQFPLYFILSNILIIPIVSVIIYGAVLMLIFSFSNAISALCAKIVYFFTYLLNSSVTLIEDLPYSKLDNLVLDNTNMIFLFVIVFISILFIISKQSRLLKSSILLAIILVSFNISNNIYSSFKSSLAIFNTQKASSISFADGNKSVLFKHCEMEHFENIYTYNIEPFLLNQKIKDEIIIDLSKNKLMNAFDFKNKRIISLSNDSIFNLDSEQKLKADLIVLSNNVNVKINKLVQYFEFKKLIFDSSNSFYTIANWTKECKKNNIPFYNVSKQGAYVTYF